MEQTKHRFNIIDFLIIVLVIAAVVSIIQRSSITESLKIGQEKVTVEYTFILENIRDTSVEKFKTDTELFLQSNNKSVGTLVEFTQSPYETYISLNDGSIAKTVVPERYSITGKVRVDVKKTDDGYFLDDNIFLAPGAMMYLKFDVIYFGVTVLDVEEVESK